MDEIRAAIEHSISTMRSELDHTEKSYRKFPNAWDSGRRSGLDAGIQKLESILSLTYRVKNDVS